MAEGSTGGLRERLLEVLAVLLLGLTTIGTAWCGYQSATWTSASSDLSERAADQRIEASRLFGLATATLSYDNTMVAEYAAASSAGNTRLLDYYRRTLVRPGFRPVLDRWEADVRAGRSPRSVVEDPAYLQAQFAGYVEASEAAEQAITESTTAGRNANSYIALTILLAAAVFFAGVTSSFRYRVARILLLGASAVIVVVVAARLASLPVI